MRLLPVLLLALVTPAKVAGSAFPGGLLDATGRMAYLGVGGAIAAVDLTAGEVRWTSELASEPLLVAGDRLYALGAGKSGGLHVRAFNVADKGQPVFESELIDLPRWAVPENGRTRSFSFTWKRDRNWLELHWQASAWADGAPRKHAAGLARTDLDTGKVRQQPTDPPGGATALPAQLEKLSVRWHSREGGRLRAVVLEEVAGSSPSQRRQQLVFRQWEERTGKETRARELLQGREPLVLVDADGRRLWLRDGATSPDLPARAERPWLVIDSVDGREVARVPFVAGTLAANIRDRRAYCLTVSAIRAVPGRPTRKGRALVAIDLDSGKVLWRRALTEVRPE
jgi:hypothetical protein